MKITIFEKLKPFSHIPGDSCLLPGSLLKLKIYPTLIQVYERSTSKLQTEIKLKIEGPVKDFTIQLDLEKGNIRVWGHSAHGYFRYTLTALSSFQEVLILTFEKAPLEIMHVSCSEGFKFWEQDTALTFSLPTQSGKEKQDLLLSKSQLSNAQKFIPPSTEKLSLGVTKRQDWNLVQSRGQLEEILPYILKLGQIFPPLEKTQNGLINLIDTAKEFVREKNKQSLKDTLSLLNKVAFEGILCPRLKDDDYQGIDYRCDASIDPLLIVSEASKIIREIFINEADKQIEILPLLPAEFHSGRFLNLKTECGVVDLEWTKKQVRRLVLRTTNNGSFQLNFPKDVVSYRLRSGELDRGRKILNHSVIDIEFEKNYCFDRFQK